MFLLYARVQSAYVVPATLFTWDFHQTELLDQYKGCVLTLEGDASCDSQGVSAKFGLYTLRDLELGKKVESYGQDKKTCQKPYKFDLEVKVQGCI